MKLKDTKLGRLLIEKIPQAKDIIGDALPENGVLGVIKNLIQGSDLSTEEKAQLLSLHELELKDRDSARNREIEIAKTGSKDWRMSVVLIVVLSLLVGTVTAVFFFDLKNQQLAHFIAGEVVGFGSAVIFYYFGTSKSSTDKTDIIRKLGK